MEANTTDKGQQTVVGEQRNWAYPSLEATGLVEVELPSLPGSPQPTELLHARAFGGHVASKIECSLRGNPYPKSGPQQNAVEVLGHYIAVAKGSKLVQPEAISRMEQLAREFASEPDADREKYFRTMVRPYLLSLTPKRREG